MHTHTHTFVHTYMHTYTHTYTCVYTALKGGEVKERKINRKKGENDISHSSILQAGNACEVDGRQELARTRDLDH